MSPTFSIVVPCYNSEKYLADAFQSISQQTFRDFEVLIVDDNSTDSSHQLALKLLSHFALRGQVLTRPAQMPRGVSSSRNLAAEFAEGEWLVFLDSDDMFKRRKLEFVSKFIADNPFCNFLFHGVDYFEHGNRPDFDTIVERETLDLERIYDVNLVVTSSVVMRKEKFFELGKFDFELNGVEDYFLWLKVFENGGVGYLPFNLGLYRILDNSLMRGRRFEYYVDQNVLLLSRLDFLSKAKFKRVETYLIDRLMNYYCNVSIGRYGFFSINKGVLLLARYGYVKVAVGLFSSRLFRVFLRTVSVARSSIIR